MAAAGVVAVVVMRAVGCRTDESPCRAALRTERGSAAVRSCRAAWHQAQTPDHGANLLLALRQANEALDPVELRAVVAVLAGTRHAGTAHAALASDKRARGDLAGARREMEAACVADEAAGNHALLARNAAELAGLCRDQRDFAAARAALVISKRAAQASSDDRMLRHVELLDTELARLTGDYHGAEAALRRLEATSDRAAQPWIHLKLGILYLVWGRSALAEIQLEKALQRASDGGTSHDTIAAAAYANLGSLARESGRYTDAERYFAAAERLNGDTAYAYELLLNRGMVDAARGDFRQAAVRLRAAAAMELDGQWTWDIPFQLGRVEEHLGDMVAAEAAYRRAITAVQVLRASSGEYEPTAIATHRQPYDALIGLLAARSRWLEVLAVLADLDARHMIAAIAEPARLSPSGDILAVQPEHPVLPIDRTVANTPPTEAIVNAWSKRQLVAVVPAGNRLCRLTLMAGRIDGACVGDRISLERDALALQGNPSDAAAAMRLGVALIPPSPDGERIDLLLIGSIARVPLAALRDGNGLIVARRPLVRVLGLVGRPRGPWTPGAVVLGAPTPDLEGALTEARRVASKLGAMAHLGSEASRTGLIRARSLGVLHVAAHATMRRAGPALLLHDGDLTLSEIAELQPTARVVVLATCDSATARDDTGWGSLASAFLIAGAEVVVATAWRVPDAEVPRLMDHFYEAGGAIDAARGLAAAQAALASKLPARTWAAFAVIAAPPSI